MNTKKVGLVTAGVVTALLAASPLAFATEGHDRGAPEGKVCSFTGGTAGAESLISGDSMYGNTVQQYPYGGSNYGNSGNCSEFDNNNGNNNGSGNTFILPAP